MASGFQGLVDGACGNVNPLMKLTTHFTEDKAKGEFLRNTNLHNGVQKREDSGLADEFLQAYPPTGTVKINSFNMKDLMRNVPTANTHHPSQTLARPDFESIWRTEAKSVSRGGNLSFSQRSSVPTGAIQSQETNWASDYLDQFDQKSNSAKKLFDVVDQDSKFSKSELKSYLKNHSSDNWADDFLQSTAKVKWEDEFVDATDNDFEAFYEESKERATPNQTTLKEDFWHSLENQWKDAGLVDEQEESWVRDFEELHANNFVAKDYSFQKNNPLKEATDCLKAGKEKLDEGDLPSAVLFFEAAAQQQPDNPEVWFLLGTSQAKNEQDIQAISALTKSLQLNSNNPDAVQALAASFANESLYPNACLALQDWIQMNPKYGGSSTAPLSCINKPTESGFMTRQQHEATMNLYLKAARLNHQNAEVDADVQNGLGILFNLSSEFEKATECFKAALSIRPNDVLLWNRLGATLANGNQSEEAVSAYHEALRLDPGFVRSRYNLGVSCINLKAYREAVDHFLAVLNFQASGRGLSEEGDLNQGPMSGSIWSTLRLALTLMGRSDLKVFIEERNLLELNKLFNVQK